MLFNVEMEPSEVGILLVKLFESRYMNCNEGSDDNEAGILPVSPHDDSIKLTIEVIKPMVCGMDPRNWFPLRFSDVILDSFTMVLGSDPTKPADANEMDTTLLDEQVTPAHADVLGPVHTLPLLGCEPVHCQLLNARIVVADNPADS